MTLFERYVRILRILLPRDQRDDVIRELSEEYRTQVADRESMLGRPLTPEEQAAIVAQFGHPLLTAARYWPQQHLIGPALFPFYWPVLKVTLGITLLVNVISLAVLFVTRSPSADLMSGAREAWTAALAVFAWVTIAFAFADRQFVRSRSLEKWKPALDASRGGVPAVALGAVHHALESGLDRARGTVEAIHRPHRASRSSLASFIAAVVFSVWWLLALRIPELMFGGGAAILTWGMDMARLYPVLLVAQLTALGEHFVRVTRPDDRRVFALTRIIWTVNGVAFLYFLLILDHRWVEWTGTPEAQARFAAVLTFQGRAWSLVDVVNYAFTIPFVTAVSIRAFNTLWNLFGRRRRTVAGAVSVAWLSLFVVQAASAQSPDDAAIRRILVDRIDVQRQSLGIVVGIITPAGRRVISQGRFSAADARPVDGDTVFEIGSVTKVFTSLLLADMARRGEVRVDDPMTRYLPPGMASAGKGRTVTLADLATHTSGLPFWPSNIPPTAEGTAAMARYTVDELYRFAAAFEPPPDAGSRWVYSNTDAGLLGALLARRAASTYEELVRARITGPLGMPSTAVALSPGMQARLAPGHDAQLKPAERWDVPALPGAGGLHSSVNDLLTLLAAAGDGTSVLGAALPTMLATRRQATGFQQAIGWMILTTAPGDDGFLLHDGSTRGFASSIVYDPKTRTGVVVLSHAAASVADIARHLLRPALPLARPAAPAPSKTEVPIDLRLFDLYAGQYAPGPGAIFTVAREGDALMLQLPGLPKLRLRPEGERDFFVAENTRVTVTFDVNAAGQVTRLVLKAPTGDVAAVRQGAVR